MGAQVTAPPAPFVITVPRGWVKPSGARVVWQASASANGPLAYAVVLDGRKLRTPGGQNAYTIDPRGLGSAVHKVQLLGTDIFGQSVLTAPVALKVDGRAPTVRIKGSSSGVTVRVGDSGSGFAARSVVVSFGDGSTRARARARTPPLRAPRRLHGCGARSATSSATPPRPARR